MKTLTKFIPACPNSPGIEGHGEGVEYDGKTFYYPRAGKSIPKNKVVALKWEGGWAGRQNGDKEYILVCFNEKNELIFLKTIIFDVRKELKLFEGMSSEQAIAKINSDEEAIKKITDSYPKCISCGGQALKFEEDQNPDECISCYNKRTINV